MPSPMLAVNAQSLKYETPPGPLTVEVWVEDPERLPNTAPGWYFGILKEWTLYEEIGWTAYVIYNVAPAERHAGRFLAERVRQYEEEPEAPGDQAATGAE